MKKNHKLIGTFLLGFFILNLFIGITVANPSSINLSGEDEVDDDLAESSKRSVEVDVEDDEIKIESILRNDVNKDKIEILVKYDIDGIALKVNYKSGITSETGPGSDYEFEFEVIFCKLIEFVDLDGDDIYNPSEDQTIKEVELNSFQTADYTEMKADNDEPLHYIKINTTDGVFTTHLYIVEEFTIVDDVMVTPTQAKIDIEIKNFNYTNNDSQIALYTKLKSEEKYKEEDETEDEENEYADDEKGVKTTSNGYTGIFTWAEKADVDGDSKEVLASDIEEDDDNEKYEKIYLNYPRGTHIYHDPKIGVADILRIPSILPLVLIIASIMLIGGSIAATSLHYHNKRKKSAISLEVYKKYEINGLLGPLISTKKDILENSNNKSSILQIFEEKNALEKISQLNDINITAISEEFLEIVNQLEWDENEKEEFIKEMSALFPEEREIILNEMIKKPNSDEFLD